MCHFPTSTLWLGWGSGNSPHERNIHSFPISLSTRPQTRYTPMPTPRAQTPPPPPAPIPASSSPTATANAGGTQFHAPITAYLDYAEARSLEQLLSSLLDKAPPPAPPAQADIEAPAPTQMEAPFAVEDGVDVDNSLAKAFEDFHYKGADNGSGADGATKQDSGSPVEGENDIENENKQIEVPPPISTTGSEPDSKQKWALGDVLKKLWEGAEAFQKVHSSSGADSGLVVEQVVQSITQNGEAVTVPEAKTTDLSEVDVECAVAPAEAQAIQHDNVDTPSSGGLSQEKYDSIAQTESTVTPSTPPLLQDQENQPGALSLPQTSTPKSDKGQTDQLDTLYTPNKLPSPQDDTNLFLGSEVESDADLSPVIVISSRESSVDLDDTYKEPSAIDAILTTKRKRVPTARSQYMQRASSEQTSSVSDLQQTDGSALPDVKRSRRHHTAPVQYLTNAFTAELEHGVLESGAPQVESINPNKIAPMTVVPAYKSETVAINWSNVTDGSYSILPFTNTRKTRSKAWSSGRVKSEDSLSEDEESYDDYEDKDFEDSDDDDDDDYYNNDGNDKEAEFLANKRNVLKILPFLVKSEAQCNSKLGTGTAAMEAEPEPDATERPTHEPVDGERDEAKAEAEAEEPEASTSISSRPQTAEEVKDKEVVVDLSSSDGEVVDISDSEPDTRRQQQRATVKRKAGASRKKSRAARPRARPRQAGSRVSKSGPGATNTTAAAATTKNDKRPKQPRPVLIARPPHPTRTRRVPVKYAEDDDDEDEDEEEVKHEVKGERGTESRASGTRPRSAKEQVVADPAWDVKKEAAETEAQADEKVENEVKEEMKLEKGKDEEQGQEEEEIVIVVSDEDEDEEDEDGEDMSMNMSMSVRVGCAR